MTRLAFIVAASLVTAILSPRVVHAQDPARAVAGATAFPSPLFVDMQLTAAQQASIDRIRQRYRLLQDEINRDTASVEVRTTMFLASRVRQRAEMRMVLTEAQRPVFDKRAAEQKAEDEEIVRQGLAMIRPSRRP